MRAPILAGMIALGGLCIWAAYIALHLVDKIAGTLGAAGH
jgi:hypothetical protein